MKILITGVNGFIGKHVIKYLKEYDCNNIHGIGRYDAFQGDMDINYYKADITDYSSLLQVVEKIKKCDVIIHMAASINMSFDDQSIIDINYIGTYNVCKLAQMLSCQKIIYISSLPVIGKPLQLPITEEHPQQPESLYHITKLSGEYLVRLMKKNGIIPIILRIPSPIGAGMNSGTILPIFLNNALLDKEIVLYGKGMRRQNYIDVRDIAQAIYKSFVSHAEGLFNIASPSSISNYELAKECIKITNSKSIIRFNGIVDPQEDYNWDISIENAKNVLGFQPEYMLADTVQWMLSNQ
jgi:UDP-glucose 4-epimerase